MSGTIAAQVPHPTSPPFPPTKPPTSPSSTDSNTDVTAYADEKVRLLEEAQQTTHQQIGVRSQKDHEREEVAVSESMPKVPSSVEAGACATSLFFRTSTPTQDAANASAGLNLTQLETGLTIAPSSRTVLPELLTITSAAVEESAVSFLQHETDDGSSSCDAPKLPTGEIRVRYLDDMTVQEVKKLEMHPVTLAGHLCMDLLQWEEQLRAPLKDHLLRPPTKCLTQCDLLHQPPKFPS